MKQKPPKLQYQTPSNEEELLLKKTKAWREKVALVITFQQLARLGNKEFETCMNIGRKLYEGIK